MPKVSICIPAYNYGVFIAEALESALAQTCGDLEVVVSDNRSTDDTRDVVERFRKRDSRVRYELAPLHVAMPENFNRCLGLAAGEYVKFLCADDVLEAGCVERMLSALEGRPEIKLAACARRMFRAGGAAGRVLGYANGKLSCAGQLAIRKCYFLGNLIGEPTAVMFRRADARDGFSLRYVQLIDMEMWFRMLEGGNFAFVPEVLCAIREHDAQATLRSLANGQVTADKELLFADFAGKSYLRGTLFEQLLWDFRMAWSAQRERAAGRISAPSAAVYFQGLRVPMTVSAKLAVALRGQ